MKFFYLAGGYGNRAQPLSFVKPKALFPLCGEPLLERIFRQLIGNGLTGGFINLHYRHQDFLPVLSGYSKVRVIFEKELTGSRVISCAATSLGGKPLLVVNGDVYLDVPVSAMQDVYRKTGADGVLLVRHHSGSAYQTLRCRQGRYLGLNSKNHRQGLMYTGVALMGPRLVKEIEEMNFFATLERLKTDVRVLVYDGVWLDLGDPRSYFHANQQFERQLKRDPTADVQNGAVKGVPVNFLSSGVTISSTSRVEESIVWEGVCIEGSSLIRRCIVTTGVRLVDSVYEDRIITERGIFDF